MSIPIQRPTIHSPIRADAQAPITHNRKKVLDQSRQLQQSDEFARVLLQYERQGTPSSIQELLKAPSDAASLQQARPADRSGETSFADVSAYFARLYSGKAGGIENVDPAQLERMMEKLRPLVNLHGSPMLDGLPPQSRDRCNDLIYSAATLYEAGLHIEKRIKAASDGGKPASSVSGASKPANPALAGTRGAIVAPRSLATPTPFDAEFSAQVDALRSRIFPGLNFSPAPGLVPKAAHPLDSEPLSASSLRELGGLKELATLDATQKRKLLNVFESADLAGGAHLVELAKRMVNGKSSLLDKDADGRTLLDNLDALAKAKLPAELERQGLSADQILSSVLRETANQSVITQGGHETCGPTTLQIKLADENPAEYARLIGGLVTKDGNIKLRNGGILARVADSVEEDGSKRGPTSRLFQSAVMDFANGRLKYSNKADKTEKGFLSKEHSGLNQFQLARAAKALFADKPGLRKLGGHKYEQGAPVLMRFESGGHAMRFEGKAGDRVLLRDPNLGLPPNGRRYWQPPLTVVDSVNGICSMGISDYEKACLYSIA